MHLELEGNCKPFLEPICNCWGSETIQVKNAFIWYQVTCFLQPHYPL